MKQLLAIIVLISAGWAQAPTLYGADTSPSASPPAQPAPKAPPTLEIPAEVPATGEYAQFLPRTDAVSVVYVGLSGVSAFPAEFLRDPRAFILPVRGLPAARYRFCAVAAGATGIQTSQEFAVVVGTPPPTPVPPGPTPVPPGPTPPTPGPSDPLTAEVQAALARESAADKAKVGQLVQYYAFASDAAAKHAGTNKALWDALVAKQHELSVTGGFPFVREVVGRRLLTFWPAQTDPAATTTAGQKAGAAAAYAAAVEGLK